MGFRCRVFSISIFFQFPAELALALTSTVCSSQPTPRSPPLLAVVVVGGGVADILDGGFELCLEDRGSNRQAPEGKKRADGGRGSEAVGGAQTLGEKTGKAFSRF